MRDLIGVDTIPDPAYSNERNSSSFRRQLAVDLVFKRLSMKIVCIARKRNGGQRSRSDLGMV